MQPAMQLLKALVGDALQGPFTRPRRFSAINADGFPFQWSVSLGDRPGGLRFVADCGVPGSSISERIAFTRGRLREIAGDLGLAGGLPALDLALDALLPQAALLEASLMGLCLGVEIDPAGRAAIKVYVNSELGTAASRYRRFERCLLSFGRRSGAKRLHVLQHLVGSRVVPAFTAVDLTSNGIGRLKLYFRPAEGNPNLASLAAETFDCGEVAQLEPLHRVFLDGDIYPAGAVDFAVEFPPEDHAIGFKLDLNARMLVASDADVDRRVLGLLEELDFDDGPYRLTRDIVVGVPSTYRVGSILFVGLAMRGRERRVNVYLHPCPKSSQ